MRINLLLASLLMSVVIASSGQGSAAMQRRMARLEAQGNYEAAASLHMKLHDAGEREAALKAGMNLYRAGKSKQSLYYLQHADSLGMIGQPEELIAFFEALKANQRYEEADDLLNKHQIAQVGQEFVSTHRQQLKNYKRFQAYQRSRVFRLPVNTRHSEFGPTVLNGWLYFSSTRPVGNDRAKAGSGASYFNLFAHPLADTTASVIQPKGQWGKPETEIVIGGHRTHSVPAEINQDHHDAPVFITPEGNFLFYTTNWDHEEKARPVNPYLNLSYSNQALDNTRKVEVARLTLNIYYSIHEKDVWSKPIPFPYNADDWSNQHAFFEEQTGALYFSSNMPGGKGGFDIWRSYLRDGTWTAPENLGPNINTPGNEVFPSKSPEGILFFASTGWPGLGGLDLFLSEDLSVPPLNLLAGINTELDDFGLTFTSAGRGFFVSNRTGGAGDDDLYGFEIDIPSILDHHRPAYLVMPVNAETGEPLTGLLSVLENDSVTIMETGPSGFKIRATEYERTITLTMEGFHPTTVTLPALGGPRERKVMLEAIKELPVVMSGPDPAVRSVYFEQERTGIRKDEQHNLNNILHLLRKYEDSRVLLTGYVENNNPLTFRLAKKRTTNVKRWLMENGVPSNRIQTAYKGWFQIGVSCSEGAGGRQSTSCPASHNHDYHRKVKVDMIGMQDPLRMERDTE